MHSLRKNATGESNKTFVLNVDDPAIEQPNAPIDPSIPLARATQGRIVAEDADEADEEEADFAAFRDSREEHSRTLALHEQITHLALYDIPNLFSTHLQ